MCTEEVGMLGWAAEETPFRIGDTLRAGTGAAIESGGSWRRFAGDLYRLENRQARVPDCMMQKSSGGSLKLLKPRES